MLYIITEDSNSARAFWGCVANAFRGKGNYIEQKHLTPPLVSTSTQMMDVK